MEFRDAASGTPGESLGGAPGVSIKIRVVHLASSTQLIAAWMIAFRLGRHSGRMLPMRLRDVARCSPGGSL